MGQRRSPFAWIIRISSLCLILGMVSAILLEPTLNAQADEPTGETSPTSSTITLATAESLTFVPLLMRRPVPPTFNSQINVPYFDGDVVFEETAIFWFGNVTPSENYADVRVGYNSDELWVHVAVFDRRLWYKQNPQIEEMTDWDAVSLFVNTGDPAPSAPDYSSYRFIGQLNWWEPREDYQAAYQGNGSGWQLSSTLFSTLSDWRGYPAPNDNQDDRGWWVRFHIPFTSLGLSGPPSTGTHWQLGVSLHDRDELSLRPEPAKHWPIDLSSTNPGTWGLINFGLPEYVSPTNVRDQQTVTIRDGLANQQVKDGMVGGYSTCAEGIEYWTEWGQTNYDGYEQVNVQNEFDVSDWPCFSKYYLTFPLNSLPANKTIVSADLTIYSVGNAGGGQWGEAPEAFVQVMTVEEEFTESQLTWNNAPMVAENVSRAWVPPITEETWVEPGVPRSWDLSYAVYKAYTQNTPLSLVLYMADGGYNTGRYFWSSDVGDWNQVQRPTLSVILGDAP